MAESSIPVDVLNPGQVFACIGFVESTLALVGDAEATFDWSNPLDVRFRVRAPGEVSPVAATLSFLAGASVRAEAPDGGDYAGAWRDGWGVLHDLSPRSPYPIPPPDSPATLVCALRGNGHAIVIDYWGDAPRIGSRSDNAKFWGGAAGYPGTARVRNALDLIRERAAEAEPDPFALAAPQSSSFRLDWRRDYIPIDAGFSLNAHNGAIEAVGYPLVELLAAIGLTHARPQRHDKLAYGYAIVGRNLKSELWLPPTLLRAALGGVALPFATRRFRMVLGQANDKERVITTVTEETS